MSDVIINLSNGNIRNAGKVENNIFYTARKPNHYFKMFQGFGISESVLKILKENNINNIIIEYFGVKGIKRYKTNTNKFLESNKEFIFNINMENDKQKFLSEREMELIK